VTKKIRISRKILVVDGERDQRCTQKGIKEQKTKRQDKYNRDVKARGEAEKNRELQYKYSNNKRS
jgi:hypothetical protein